MSRGVNFDLKGSKLSFSPKNSIRFLLYKEIFFQGQPSKTSLFANSGDQQIGRGSQAFGLRFLSDFIQSIRHENRKTI